MKLGRFIDEILDIDLRMIAILIIGIWHFWIGVAALALWIVCAVLCAWYEALSDGGRNVTLEILGWAWTAVLCTGLVCGIGLLATGHI